MWPVGKSAIDNKMHVGKEALTYSEHDGKREESFNRAIKAIVLVVRSEV